jgi:hypothetical protein
LMAFGTTQLIANAETVTITGAIQGPTCVLGQTAGGGQSQTTPWHWAVSCFRTQQAEPQVPLLIPKRLWILRLPRLEAVFALLSGLPQLVGT